MGIAAIALLALLTTYLLLAPERFNRMENDRSAVLPTIDLDALQSRGHPLYEAICAFENKSYSEVIHDLATSDLEDSSYRDTAEYYLGAAYLYSGRPAEAVEHFDELLSGESVYAGNASAMREVAQDLIGRRPDTLSLIRRNWVLRWFLIFGAIGIMAIGFYVIRFHRPVEKPLLY